MGINQLITLGFLMKSLGDFFCISQYRNNKPFLSVQHLDDKNLSRQYYVLN